MLLIIGLLALTGLSLWLLGTGPAIFTKDESYSPEVGATYAIALTLIALGSLCPAIWLIIK